MLAINIEVINIEVMLSKISSSN